MNTPRALLPLLLLGAALAPAPAAPAPGLRAYYRLDETGGATAADDSGAGLAAAYGAGAAAPAPDLAEKAPLAFPNAASLAFDGVDDVLNAGSPAALDNLPALSVSAWIRPSSLGENAKGRVVDKANGTAPTDGWILNLSDATADCLSFIVDFSGGDLVRRSAAGTITMNAWQHVAVTWNGSAGAAGIRLFIDGAEPAYSVSTNGSGTRASDAAESLKIGNDKSGARTFDGRIDDVRVYDRVLTAAEVAYLAAGQGLPPSAPSLDGAVQTPGLQAVVLTWTASATTPPTPVAYTIRRSTVPGGPYVAVATGLSGTTWTDLDVVFGTTYHYVASAVNVGGESAPSAERAVEVLPPAPRTDGHDEGLVGDACACGSSIAFPPPPWGPLAALAALGTLLRLRRAS